MPISMRFTSSVFFIEAQILLFKRKTMSLFRVVQQAASFLETVLLTPVLPETGWSSLWIGPWLFDPNVGQRLPSSTQRMSLCIPEIGQPERLARAALSRH